MINPVVLTGCLKEQDLITTQSPIHRAYRWQWIRMSPDLPRK
jgi:hypothetical protein